MPADFYAAPSLYLAPWQEYASNLQTQAFVWAVENGQAQDTPAELGRFIHEGRKGASSWAEWYRRAADAVGAEFAGSAALTLAELVARNMDPRDYGFPTWTPADYVPPGPEKDAIYEREMWGGDRVVENPGVMEVGGFSRPVLMAEPEEPTPTAIQNAAAGRVAAREIDAATTYLTQNDPGTPAGELVPFSGDMEALKGVDASLSISWGTVAFLALLALGIYVAQRMGLF